MQLLLGIAGIFTRYPWILLPASICQYHIYNHRNK